MSSAWSNVPSHEDNSPTWLGQTAAVAAGVFLTVFVGLPLAGYALSQVVDVFGHLIVFVIAAYLVALSVQFWVAQSYKNGMTKKELLFAALWPLDVVRSIRRGVRAAAGQYPGTGYKSDDDGEKVIDENTAFLLGAVVSLVAFVMLLVGIYSALVVIGSVVWLLVVVWMVGAIVQFWVSSAWKDGLTRNEVIRAVIWPVGMAEIIRAGVKRFKTV